MFLEKCVNSLTTLLSTTEDMEAEVGKNIAFIWAWVPHQHYLSYEERKAMVDIRSCNLTINDYERVQAMHTIRGCPTSIMYRMKKGGGYG